MKWLCTILALIVLILSVQPVCATVSLSGAATCCSPADQCDEVSEQNEEGSADHSGQACSNGCNPFQVCACCAFSVVTPQHIPFMTQLHFAMSAAQWGLLSLRFSEEPASGFWQPPRAV